MNYIAWRLMSEEDYGDYIEDKMTATADYDDDDSDSARERAERRNIEAFENDELDLY